MKIKPIYMRLVFTTVLSVLCSYSNAQVTGNYVKTETYLSSSQKIQSYKFYDGIGRDIVVATNGIARNGNFSISLNEIEGENLISKNGSLSLAKLKLTILRRMQYHRQLQCCILMEKHMKK